VTSLPGGPFSFLRYSESALPRGSRVLFNGGSPRVTVRPRQMVRLPLRLVPARRAPLGKTFYVSVQASAVTELRPPSHPLVFGQLEDTLWGA